MQENEADNNLGWWSMAGRAFMDALERAYAGEKPEDIYLEYYVNSEIERNHLDD